MFHYSNRKWAVVQAKSDKAEELRCDSKRTYIELETFLHLSLLTCKGKFF